jgi:hypothetical protein
MAPTWPADPGVVDFKSPGKVTVVTRDDKLNGSVYRFFISTIFEFLATSNAMGLPMRAASGGEIHSSFACEIPELSQLKPNLVPTSIRSTYVRLDIIIG